jgi:hypothetical protein
MTCLAASYLGSGLALASARQEPSSFRARFVVQSGAVGRTGSPAGGGMASPAFAIFAIFACSGKTGQESHLGHELIDN